MDIKDEDVFEKLLDANGLKHVLEVLSEICHAKSDHVMSNWQDHNLARAWADTGNKIEGVAESRTVRIISEGRR